LLELAEKYAGKFGVDSLNVYDALKDVWRVSNTNAELVTASKPVRYSYKTHPYIVLNNDCVHSMCRRTLYSHCLIRFTLHRHCKGVPMTIMM